MRRSRYVVAALMVSSFCAAPVAWSQQTRANDEPASAFQNSWFWGLHAGSTSLNTPAQSSTMAGTIGAEWLITRSKGGLYAAYDHAQFHRTSAIADPSASVGVRSVSIGTLRSASVAALAFPVQWSHFRPYAGIGVQMHVIGDATALPDSEGAPASQDVNKAIEDARSRSTPFLMLGGQWQHGKAALFAQVASTTSSDSFLITSSITLVTVGLRYNFGRSIDY